MKRVFFASMIMLAVCLAGPAREAQAASCSNATLYDIGTYGWAGEDVYPPGIAVGYITFLSSGSFLGSIYGGTNGSGATSNLSGTYTVNSNCTMTASFSSGIKVQGTVVSGGQEVLLDQTSPAGVNLIVDLKAVVAESCSDSTLYTVGTYGWASNEVYPVKGTWVGYITFTSSGSFAGLIYGGYSGSGSSSNISGTYSVYSNCTLSLTFSNGVDLQGVIVSNGAEVLMDQTYPTGENALYDLKKE